MKSTDWNSASASHEFSKIMIVSLKLIPFKAIVSSVKEESHTALNLVSKEGVERPLFRF
jgi:hypothetical protein